MFRKCFANLNLTNKRNMLALHAEAEWPTTSPLPFGHEWFVSAELARARCKTQTPGPVDAVYPVLIADFAAPYLRTYPVYTVIAEKLYAMVLLGMTKSRLKDYLDLSVLLEREALDPATLATAIAATFTRRGTTLPTELPIGLSDEFANDQSRQALWAAFLKKNALPAVPLPSVVATLRATLQPALRQAASMDHLLSNR